MNKELKNANIWYLVITHLVTSGFLMPLFLNLLITVPLALYVLPSTDANDFFLFVLAQFLSLTGLIWGLHISANYLNKRYFIRNKKKLVNYSTGLLALLLILNLYFWEGNLQDMYIEIMSSLVTILVFYILSNRWIKSH